MSLLLNILWLIFGGFITGLGWLISGLVLACTIVGLPWSFAAWRIAGFVFWPFGREIVDRAAFMGRADIGTGDVNFVLNVIWFVFAGWWLALGHLVLAVAQAVTIIGLPFAFKNLQLAGLALAPVGKMVVDVDEPRPTRF
jgi:uncharacterized membrane protein YccF (DUF307 family)